jgi:hypothetical protein
LAATSLIPILLKTSDFLRSASICSLVEPSSTAAPNLGR